MADRKMRSPSRIPLLSSSRTEKTSTNKRFAPAVAESHRNNPISKKLKFDSESENIPPPNNKAVTKQVPRVATMKKESRKPRRSFSLPLLAKSRVNNQSLHSNRPVGRAIPQVKSNSTQRVPIVASKPPISSSASTVGGRPEKRASWDYKGQLMDSKEKISKLITDKNSLIKKNQQMEYEYNQMSANLELLEQTRFENDKQISDQMEVIRKKDQDMLNIRKELFDHQQQKMDIERKLSDSQHQVSLLQSERSLNQLQIEKLTAELRICMEDRETERNKLQSQIKELQEKFDKISSRTINLETELEASKIKITQQEDELRAGEKARRMMHNQIQDLKGNIRVFCRVRPLLRKEEHNQSTEGCIAFPDPDRRNVVLSQVNGKKSSLNESCTSTCSSSSANSNNSKIVSHEFSFDRVFDPNCRQEDVFQEISQLVQSVLDGYNVCIFAYGPTGSGKTYTMEGVTTDPDDETSGMIPRCVEQIFETIAFLESQGWKYEIQASFLEIYNETIKDLLGSKSDQKHNIKMDADGEVYVSELTHVLVDDSETVYDLIRKARKNRAVAKTNCNERSSRSHSVFMLRLNGTNKITSESCKGILNLVDLAGSERLKVSGSVGEQLRETKSINKSLSNLVGVVLALGRKDEHIPYRNSKLTHLLSNSLGGNSKTLMFINVSPSEDHYTETLNSLRFAKTVNECHIGVAQKRK